MGGRIAWRDRGGNRVLRPDGAADVSGRTLVEQTLKVAVEKVDSGGPGPCVDRLAARGLLYVCARCRDGVRHGCNRRGNAADSASLQDQPGAACAGSGDPWCVCVLTFRRRNEFAKTFKKWADAGALCPGE